MNISTIYKGVLISFILALPAFLLGSFFLLLGDLFLELSLV